MHCDKVQELILTDYLDHEMSEEQCKAIESHLADCHKCKELAHKACKVTIDPFEQLERIKPSPRLWQNIKEVIEEDPGPAVRVAPSGLWEKWKQWFPLPRPAVAIATVAVMIVMVLTVLSKQVDQNHVAQVAHVEAEEQLEYFVTLIEVIDNIELNENGGYGTAIEEYFL